jgi:hypothetical protein
MTTKEFNSQTVEQASISLSGKTLVRMYVEDDRSDSYLVFEFSDGSKLKFRYDYIYDIEVTP